MKLTTLIRELSDRIRIFKAVGGLTGGTSGVDSVVITNPGTGYTADFAVTFTASGLAGATGTAIVEDGEVVSVTITDRGTGATDLAVADFSAGDGTGAAGLCVMAALKLDAIPTEDLLPPIAGLIVIGDDCFIYCLTAGTDAESLPNVIRPDDYAGGTNEKVWKLKSFAADTLPTPSTFRLKDDGGTWKPQIQNNIDDLWHTLYVTNIEGVAALICDETGEA